MILAANQTNYIFFSITNPQHGSACITKPISDPKAVVI